MTLKEVIENGQLKPNMEFVARFGKSNIEKLKIIKITKNYIYFTRQWVNTKKYDEQPHKLDKNVILKNGSYWNLIVEVEGFEL